jgi:hypothetical protein
MDRMASNADASTVSSRVGVTVLTPDGTCAVATPGKPKRMASITRLNRIQDFSV